MLRTGLIAAALAVSALAFSSWGDDADRRDMKLVRINAKTLAVSTDEVSMAQWQACVADKACEDIASPQANAARLPMTGVNWFDVQAYVAWVNARQGRSLRLPTREEWTAIQGAVDKPRRKALFDDPRMAWAANYGLEETPRGPVRIQGAWSQSKDGIRDLEGNVWEWTSTCGNAATDADRCPAFSVMGAHESVLPIFIRNPASGGCATGTPPTHVGFRLVEDID